MAAALRIGGAPPCFLSAPPPDPRAPAFIGATVLPGRGMMLLQANLRLPSGDHLEALVAPDLPEAARRLDGGPGDFAGNASFSFGGAILAPFANRIRGDAIADAGQIETTVGDSVVRLPRNWGGRQPGAEEYAMHGLLLDAPARVGAETSASVKGRLLLADPRTWPGRLRFGITWALADGALTLEVIAENVGSSPAPVGIGWHPYFRTPSGDRAQARLRLAARTRVVVNNYDEVLPTGALQPVTGSPYDFTTPQGRALGSVYLDDCFTDLDRGAGNLLAELRDQAAGFGLRLTSSSPHIRAIQVFAPPEEPFVVIEPQFNLADPYGSVWDARDTGMVLLSVGASTAYRVRVAPFAL